MSDKTEGKTIESLDQIEKSFPPPLHLTSMSSDAEELSGEDLKAVKAAIDQLGTLSTYSSSSQNIQGARKEANSGLRRSPSKSKAASVVSAMMKKKQTVYKP